jgi:hypothetical protein
LPRALNPVLIRRAQTPPVLQILAAGVDLDGADFSASSDSHSYEHSSRFVEPFLHWLFPRMPQARVEAIHHIIRKCGHLTEYAVLALLLWRAVRRPVKNDPRPGTGRKPPRARHGLSLRRQR